VGRKKKGKEPIQSLKRSYASSYRPWSEDKGDVESEGKKGQIQGVQHFFSGKKSAFFAEKNGGIGRKNGIDRAFLLGDTPVPLFRTGPRGSKGEERRRSPTPLRGEKRHSSGREKRKKEKRR